MTVLRFLSPALARAGAIAERDFYRTLGAVLFDCRASQPQLEPRFRMFEPFALKMPKVCINRVRFASGYDDSAGA